LKHTYEINDDIEVRGFFSRINGIFVRDGDSVITNWNIIIPA